MILIYMYRYIYIYSYLMLKIWFPEINKNPQDSSINNHKYECFPSCSVWSDIVDARP